MKFQMALRYMIPMFISRPTLKFSKFPTPTISSTRHKHRNWCRRLFSMPMQSNRINCGTVGATHAYRKAAIDCTCQSARRQFSTFFFLLNHHFTFLLVLSLNIDVIHQTIPRTARAIVCCTTAPATILTFRRALTSVPSSLASCQTSPTYVWKRTAHAIA